MKLKLPVFIQFRIIIYFIIAMAVGFMFSWLFNHQLNSSMLIQQNVKYALEDGANQTEKKCTGNIDEAKQNYRATDLVQSRRDFVRKAYPLTEFFEGLILLLGLLYLYFYTRPVILVLKNGRTGCNENIVSNAKSRIQNIPRISFILSWIIHLLFFLNKAVFDYIYYREFAPGAMSLELFAIISSAFVSSAILLVWFEAYILKYIPRMYSEDELYLARTEGESIRLRNKLLLIVFSICIIPIVILLYMNGLSNHKVQELFTGQGKNHVRSLSHIMTKDLLPVLFTMAASAALALFSFIIAFISVKGLKKSLLDPLDMLIGKMERVKDGDYKNYNRVLTNDEIGQLCSHFNRMLEGLEQREFIKDTFGRFMSAEIARKILEMKDFTTGGEEVEATVLFTDIRDFTSISENLEPAEVVAFLNEFFSYLVEPVNNYKGVVNKYIGDCIMALFGVPYKISGHSQNAFMAAIEMKKSLEQYNLMRNEKNLPAVKIGIGIHTGRVVAGNIGATSRLEYTVIGDTVNIASRIESATKELDSILLISSDVYEKLGKEIIESYSFEKCPGIRVKGKSETLDLYKVL